MGKKLSVDSSNAIRFMQRAAPVNASSPLKPLPQTPNRAMPLYPSTPDSGYGSPLELGYRSPVVPSAMFNATSPSVQGALFGHLNQSYMPIGPCDFSQCRSPPTDRREVRLPTLHGESEALQAVPTLNKENMLPSTMFQSCSYAQPKPHEAQPKSHEHNIDTSLHGFTSQLPLSETPLPSHLSSPWMYTSPYQWHRRADLPVSSMMGVPVMSLTNVNNMYNNPFCN